ncbi:MAG: hypothetical protein HXY39_01040 [Chloroflexi bacterium]|nr:hypothetical protein [Chloroflexota bacterium]
MTQPASQKPYIEVKPGDLITAESWNELQQHIRADLAANAEADARNVAELKEQIANVDAPKFGGRTPDDWTNDLDKRYIKRDEPQAAGQYHRYFKQLNRTVVVNGQNRIEPAVITHNLCRFPLVDVYRLMPLFSFTNVDGTEREIGREEQTRLGLPDNWKTVKFLVYYASKRDPISDLLYTEAPGDRFYWGDPLTLHLDQFGVRPTPTQAFDDLLNDLWGNMFDPGNEQDQFDRDAYGNSPYTQNWIEKDGVTVGDLMKRGQWPDLRVAVRPQQMPITAEPVAIGDRQVAPRVSVFHISQNAIEIHASSAVELMVLIRT